MDSAVFDTNILIGFSRSDPRCEAVLLKPVYRYISVVTWIEFLTGVPESEFSKSKEFLHDMFDVIDPEEDIYELTVDLRRRYRRKLKLPDAMIYATAKHLKCPLVTFNTKDFDESADDVVVPY